MRQMSAFGHWSFGREIQVSGGAALWLGSSVDAKLELLTIDHARPLARFERANRAFFAAQVGDRGNDFFEHFDDYLGARVNENREGTSLFFVILDADGEVLGRVNISDIDQPKSTSSDFGSPSMPKVEASRLRV